MSDQEQSTAAPVDWTDDGIYRAAYLHAIFDPEDRELIRRVGIVFACQALSGDTFGPIAHPTIERDLGAVSADLYMVSRQLREIAAMYPNAETEEQHTLCSMARSWQESVEDLAVQIAANVEEEPEGAPAGALRPEEAAAALRLLAKLRAALEEARNLQHLDRDGVIGRSVGNLAESLTVLEDAIKDTTK